jgi:hypothetical protein
VPLDGVGRLLYSSRVAFLHFLPQVRQQAGIFGAEDVHQLGQQVAVSLHPGQDVTRIEGQIEVVHRQRPPRKPINRCLLSLFKSAHLQIGGVAVRYLGRRESVPSIPRM